MCLIVHKPEGARIPEAIIKSALEWNQDGAGIMTADKVTKSAHMSEDKLLTILDKDVGDKECAVHLRMATHGRVNRYNTHPFKLNGSGWLMHNGIFSKYASKNLVTFKSDTAQFVDKAINKHIKSTGKLPSDKILEGYCGYDNKLAIMTPDGKFHRYGEWTEYLGLQMSNTYAWDYPYTKKYGSYKPYVFDDNYTQYDLETDIGAVILDAVYKHADDLFSRGNMVTGMDTEDSERYMDVFVEGTDSETFLAACSMRSIVAIYDTLVKEGYL